MFLTVYKFDPAVDVEPYYVQGEVPFQEHMTGLHALMYFDENVEHVNYDHSCRARACGRCAMMLNGEPTLMCTHFLEDKDYTIEPLRGFRVIRDLIVDKSPLDAQLTGVYNRVRVEPFDAQTIAVDMSDYAQRHHDVALWLGVLLPLRSVRCGLPGTCGDARRICWPCNNARFGVSSP